MIRRIFSRAALGAALILTSMAMPASATTFNGTPDTLIVSGWYPWSSAIRFTFWVMDTGLGDCVNASTFTAKVEYRKHGAATWNVGNQISNISPDLICRYEYLMTVDPKKLLYKKDYDVRITVTEASTSYAFTQTLTGVRRGTPFVLEGDIWPVTSLGQWRVGPDYAPDVKNGKAKPNKVQLKYRLAGSTTWQQTAPKSYSWAKRYVTIPGATNVSYPGNPFSKVSDCLYRLKSSYGWGPWVWCGSDTSEDYLAEYYY